VLDSSVVVSAFRSRIGASSRLLWLVEDGRLVPLATPALFLEYEDVLKRPEQREASGLSLAEVDTALTALAALTEPVEVRFTWRPQLAEPACQRRRENASACRSENASSMNARRPPRGPSGVLVGWRHPPGARLALSVRCVEALGTGDGQSRPNPRGRSIA